MIQQSTSPPAGESAFRSMPRESRIFVAGHRGLVGSALVRKLGEKGYSNIITRTRSELDLTSHDAVADFFSIEKPEFVFLAAAKVGGILANNTFPADFIYQNLMIQSNVIHQSCLNKVKRLLFLGSSCIYPKHCPQPMKEEYLLTGALEPTNSPYAVAKIAGIEMCHAYNRQYESMFIPVMPTNLYGPHDNFDLQNSHVLPAMIRKFHLARLASEGRFDAITADENRYGKIPGDVRQSLDRMRAGGKSEVVIWGSGTPKREFLHVDDLADACIFLMNLERNFFNALGQADKRWLINVGVGLDLTIRELAERVADAVGFSGELTFDPEKPDGTPQKLLDVSKLTDLGWKSTISLEDGIRQTYRWYQNLDG